MLRKAAEIQGYIDAVDFFKYERKYEGLGLGIGLGYMLPKPALNEKMRLG